MSLKKYELVILVSPENIESEAVAVADQIKAGLTKRGAEITFEDFWGKRDLAYPIRKQTSAYYFLIEMEIMGSEIAPLEQELLLNKEVMRHLVVLSPDGYQIAKFDDLQDPEEEKKTRKPAPKKTVSKPRVTKKAAPVKEDKKEEETESKEQLDEKLNKLLSDDLDI